MECDFKGYVTKNDVKCTDGVTIKHDAFASQDGMVVPLVFNHQGGKDINNILGHIKLENRSDGVYGYGKFNDTPNGQNAKRMVAHGDLNSMSIWANNITKVGNDVVHGTICEVSLVLKGANPLAKIDKVYISHSDGSEEISEDEIVIENNIEFDNDPYVKQSFTRNDIVLPQNSIEHSEKGSKTIQDVLDTLTEEQQEAVYAVTTAAIDAMFKSEDVKHDDEEGDDIMHVSPFNKTAQEKLTAAGNVEETKAVNDEIIHSAISEMVTTAMSNNASLRQTVINHADDLERKYGITNIEVMFPDAHDVSKLPEFIMRDMGWVSTFLNGVKHAPFSRQRLWLADITHDEARALGYITGNFKKEEYFSVSSRETRPTTIYKKQKFDRDHLLDTRNQAGIISWVRGEMRIMWNEELARACLIGDGRDILDLQGKPNPDKIDEDCIRPIWKEPELFATHYDIYNNLPTGTGVTSYDRYSHMIDNIIRAMDDYEGSGSPVMFMSSKDLTEILLLKDKLGRRLYSSASEFANAIGVERIIKVPQLKTKLVRKADNKTTGETETEGKNYQLFAIIVDLRDYTIGADEGGQLTSFDHFDIDFNQYKYLIEGRCSGSLMKIHSAVILEYPEDFDHG